MLRVLATWDPKALPAPHIVRECEDESRLGLLPDTDADDWFAQAWDPQDDYVPNEHDEFAYIRETPRGIEMRRHPESVLRDTPRLWDSVSKWRSGLSQELTRAEYDTLTNYEIECWLTLRAAHNREIERRMRTASGAHDGQS